MDLFKAINTRRSIRSFQDQDISDEIVMKIIKSAMLAPSAGNQQPWQFIVVRDRQKLDAVPQFHPYCKMITKAPVAIVVCGDPQGKKWPDFWVQDCSAAIQNLLLAARGEGVGSVWTGVHPVEDRVKGCRELFNIPDHVIPLAIIPLGIPESEGVFKEASRFKENLIHQEIFQ